MNGSIRTLPTATATIFGTKTSVLSWICVSAWRKPIPRPTISAIAKAGPEISSAVHIPSRVISMMSASVMFLARVHSELFVPLAPRSSDRHAHDFLIGLDDLVAHGDGRLQRYFGVVHCEYHVADIHIAGNAVDRLQLAGLEALDCRLRGVLERTGE